ncbi:hypothetical protein C1645_833252 [Glomus cerebriforme]|uniref:Serine-threonine/tyrosine-protein kinase catalytic domain-containing protein n=1 Tax=Glomus cerebriforme TaxID=658196 RepID=A0A397SME0_9GLOM|nr:hypothetical protein C1645_833252 [Glomus cerebriforme]
MALILKCWKLEPYNRPTMNQVIAKLKTIITINNYDSVSQNFYKADIKEIEPTTKNINKNIFEEDLSIIIAGFSCLI